MPSHPDAPPHSVPARGIEPQALVALAIVVALALTRLPEPFAWDQAMYMLGARVLHHGGVLYRDYWDPKQPGLFTFYWLAGTLFGFNELGVHALELIFMTLFGLTQVLTLRSRLQPSWALAAAPLLTVGWYFAVCTDWHLTQIEGLAGFPLWLALWCATRGAESERGDPLWWLAAGLAGGIALTLKLLLAPVVLAIALPPLVALAGRRPGLGRLVPAILAGALGLVVPLAVMAGYFAAHHAMALALWTSFDYPTQLIRRVQGFRIEPFFAGLEWFARTWNPLLPFTLVGAWSALRPRFDPLWMGLVTWFGAGVVVILMQPLSYWEYQYLLLSVPVGLLAARGIATLVPVLYRFAPEFPRRERRMVLAVAVALMLGAPLVPAVGRLTTLVHHRFGLTAGERRAYQTRVSHGGGYSKILADLGPLQRPDAHPGAIWVLGNPLYYWLSGREQAVPRNGASFIDFLWPEEWRSLTESLARAKPAYIHIQREYDYLMGPRHPETASFTAWLGREYDPISNDERGTWYAPHTAMVAR